MKVPPWRSLWSGRSSGRPAGERIVLSADFSAGGDGVLGLETDIALLPP
jgi:hypothetical protein